MIKGHEYLVSIIIPTRNRANLVGRAIRSVLNQTYSNIECIVVDGNSTDNTEDVVKRIQDSRIKFLKQKINLNASSAINEGLGIAKGDYLSVLDDDDELLPFKIEKQLSKFESVGKNVGLVYCWMDYYDNKGTLIYEAHPLLRGKIFKDVLVSERICGTPTFLFSKEVYNTVGGWDSHMSFGADGEFIRRVSKAYEIELVPEVLVRVNIGHEYNRMSNLNESKDYLIAVFASKRIYHKYLNDFKQYPEQHSLYLSKIAYYYSHIKRNKLKTLKYIIISILIYPLGMGKYKSIIRSFRNIFSQK